MSKANTLATTVLGNATSRYTATYTLVFEPQRSHDLHMQELKDISVYFRRNCWRVMTGRHTTYLFVIVRNTKFSPDLCFAVFKCLFKSTKVDGTSDSADFLTALLRVMSLNLCTLGVLILCQHENSRHSSSPTFTRYLITNNTIISEYISFTSPGTVFV
jgi:hypothetical protein